MNDDIHCQECGGDLAHPEDMAWRLADALRRVLYGADDGTTHPERVTVAIEAIDTYDRWHAKWSQTVGAKQ